MSNQFSVRTHNEFSMFIDTLRNMGVPHFLSHCLEKEEWQQIVFEAGFNITSLACTGIVIGDVENREASTGVMFVFSCGPSHWTTGPGGDKGHGPTGAFMFAYDMSKKKITKRRHVKFGTGEIDLPFFGVHALFLSHGLGEPPTDTL
jgi:hypothetical protein